ncbi:SpoIIE family protein phosphatase [Streptomyces sp. NBC_01762]|uniref:PP2C family protein-serine/threonine phosphatase n=1 Tax=unclassified Streptomyces TaxID=2593676 RepID=UPI002DD7BD24|nr:MULTISPECIES: SpoIIE family protein phosphatase [unclassified Streptomyces]WSC43034.1 SpoIIE family protein phosphatase [Streptomyces sp. NBC_01762]WSD22571.1 SpoIIE family protein phosphatase [Streptomyces sp. NBC_01751]
MREPGIDYHAIFEASPSAMLVLNSVFVILDANPSYQNLVGRTRDELMGRYVFDAFPQDDGSEMEDQKASMRRVLESRAQDVAGPIRHDLEEPDRPGVFAERYWSPINAPVLDSDGQVALIVHRLEEITDLVRAGGPDVDHRRRQMKLELYARSRELQQVNERLRQTNARERQIALALQDSMLPAPQALARHQAAVRYRPAVHTLNVCGDWYDVTQLSNGKYAVAVGDVVGHGLAAAGVMGQLRSALSAAIRVVGGPASALDGLDLYARSVDGALSTTAVQTIVAWADHRITYSSAGHPPPALADPDGTVRFLDQATDPPLGASLEHTPRPQTSTTYANGATLVLYTDGLIERRGEDIDQGLQRLADHLARHGNGQVEALADELIDLSSATDDTAVVVVRL